jgi:hypothetical protein
MRFSRYSNEAGLLLWSVISFLAVNVHRGCCSAAEGVGALWAFGDCGLCSTPLDSCLLLWEVPTLSFEHSTAAGTTYRLVDGMHCVVMCSKWNNMHRHFTQAVCHAVMPAGLMISGCVVAGNGTVCHSRVMWSV